MSQMLLLGNPRKRRSRRKSAKRRTHSKRRMTAKQLQYFGPRKRRSSARTHRRSRRSSARREVVVVNPSRRARRYGRRARAELGSLRTGAMSLAKTGFSLGLGAVAVDVGYGMLGSFLPASVTSKVDATTGNVNWLYYVTKGAIALGIGVYGRRVIPGNFAARMAEGSFTVMAYELIRGMIPAGAVPLGYFNPAPVLPMQNPNAIVSSTGMAAYNRLGVFQATGPGAAAASAMRRVK